MKRNVKINEHKKSVTRKISKEVEIAGSIIYPTLLLHYEKNKCYNEFLIENT